MIKQLQKIGNSRGLVLDKALLQLLNVADDGSVEILPRDEGLLIKRADHKLAYEFISAKHRKSLDKLAE